MAVRRGKDGRNARLGSVINPYQTGRNFANAAGRRLYVGNLSFEVTWQDLKDHFKSLGGTVVRADVMMEQSGTGRSKGCGLVEMNSVAEARECMECLNDTELKGRLIFVREDREAIPHDNNRGGGGGGGGGSRSSGSAGRPTPTASGCRVYVGNLSWDVKWQDLKDFCKPMGNVVRADVLTDPTGRSKGGGLVEFSTPYEAQRAINELNDQDLCGRPVFVREDREDHGGRGGGGGMIQDWHGGRQSGGGGGGGGGRRVYFGNLSWEVSWMDLKTFARQAGEVLRSDVIAEPNTGRSNGCGVVEYANAMDANNAIVSLNNREFFGRPVFVREDREEGKGGTNGAVIISANGGGLLGGPQGNHPHGNSSGVVGAVGTGTEVAWLLSNGLTAGR